MIIKFGHDADNMLGHAIIGYLWRLGEASALQMASHIGARPVDVYTSLIRLDHYIDRIRRAPDKGGEFEVVYKLRPIT